jgi:MoaD family protein
MRYFAQVREAAGVEAEELAMAEGSTLISLLRHAATLHGEAFRSLVLTAEGQVRPSLIVLRNGVPTRQSPEGRLSAGDEVSIFSPVSGG